MGMPEHGLFEAGFSVLAQQAGVGFSVIGV